MEATTTNNRTLEIDGMTGEACVQKVTGALKSVNGVTTQSVKVGSATISADQSGSDAAVAAINGAGYKSRDRAGSNGTGNNSGSNSGNNGSGGQSANLQANKPAGQTGQPGSNGGASNTEPKLTDRPVNPNSKPATAQV